MLPSLDLGPDPTYPSRHVSPAVDLDSLLDSVHGVIIAVAINQLANAASAE